jgi:hypothetical protein
MHIDVKLNRSRQIINATCLYAGIWRILAWSKQDTLLPFMNPSEDIPKNRLIVEEIEINNVYYTKVTAVTGLQDYTYCQPDDNEVVYLRNPDLMPAWLYDAGVVVQIGYGITSGETYYRDGVLYKSGLNYIPEIIDEADNLTAGQMRFHSADIEAINTGGEFDNAIQFIGNNADVYLRDGDTATGIREYYIKDVSLTLDRAVFICGDKRERLSQNIPNQSFSAVDYPYMSSPTGKDDAETRSDSIGAIIPDAYGRCINIPAVCVNPYNTDSAANRIFKVARIYTTLEKVEVKMTQPESGAEVWTNQTSYVVNRNPGGGTFELPTSRCMPAWKQSGDPYNIPEVFDVRVTGTFSNQNTAGEIIKELLRYYCHIPYEPDRYDQTEFTAELAGMGNIGICFTEETGIFEAIEKIQNAAIYSFQFRTAFDKFTARRDNNNRALSRTIKDVDIVNIDDVEIRLNTAEYATILDIAYNHDYYAGESAHLVNTDNQKTMLKIAKVDKTYKADTMLTTAVNAQAKSDYLETYFQTLHPIIGGVKLAGKEWFGIRAYDIVSIDLRHRLERRTLPRHIAALFSPALPYYGSPFGGIREQMIGADFEDGEEYREFIGVKRCKVMQVKINAENETIELELLILE